MTSHYVTGLGTGSGTDERMVTEDGRSTSTVRSCRKGQNKAKKITLTPNFSVQGQTRPIKPKSAKMQTKNFQAKSDQKMPNLTYLALRKAKWQPFCGMRCAKTSTSNIGV